MISSRTIAVLALASCPLLASPPAAASTEIAILLAAASASHDRSDAYRVGQKALEEERWNDAARAFAPLASGRGPEADAALYWKAYADWKALRKKEALEGLRRLASEYPDSRWADDARTLEQEVRGGKAVKSAVDADDEELKLQALEGLSQVEPDKAVPILERLLAGSSSPRVKERALFVLSQYDSARAREVLIKIARGGESLEMRAEAVKTLGIAGEPDDIAALAEIARDASTPPEIRGAVIEAYMIADRTEELVAIARDDKDPRLRGKAIEALGAIGEPGSLRQLWASEKDPRLRGKLLEAFGIAEDLDTLSRIARESPEPEIRRKAIEGIGIVGGPEAAQVLRDLYAKTSEPADKRKLLEAFIISDDAHALVELFRAEKDPALKRSILQALSTMDDPEATRVILDVLGEKP